jgi:hypothetical protein
VGSGGIDEDEFRILLSRDVEFGLVDGSDAVTDSNPVPVDEDHALGRGEIGVPDSSCRVGESGSGKKRGTQHPRIGTDQEGVGILRIAACQFDETSGAISLGEFAAVPTRRPGRVGVEATRSGRV